MKKASPKQLIKQFQQGFTVAIGNPKAIVFFTALFPQFIDLQSTDVLQMFLIVTVTSSCAFICAILYAICGNQLANIFAKSKLSKIFNKITGGFFVGGGLAVMFSSRA